MDAKTYVFGNDSNGNNNDGGWGGNGWPMWLLFMWALFGGRGFGNWGNNGPENMPAILNGDAGRELLMNAIQGNGNAINTLATNLNCSIGQVQAAIQAMGTQIQQVGNQVGMSSLQIINAIQAGNNTLAAQIAQCCCENRLAICNQTNTLQNSINGVAVGQERGFSNLSYTFEKSISDSTEKILAGQRQAEMREMQNKIDRLLEENGTYKTSAMTSQIVGQATAPLGAALSDLSARLAKIECNQPEVAKVPYSPVVGVPTCVAAQYGLGLGYPYGAAPGFFG